MLRYKKNIGDWGEEQSCGFLRRKGFAIIERNFHAVAGEIDIVAVKGGDYYFVEVKTRAAGDLANDLSITAGKKKKMLKTIKAYCYRKNIGDVSIIPAGIVVSFNRADRTVGFRFFVF